ncbi:hypothetical protein [Paraburkholderia terrae]|jgi:hypothetical protein|uniref:Uncharacterized protein n=1 Tax=Paraburkholderia terrae TaxID=311230 RepID=A0A2I8F1X5_9BURK|nr:hypothetical protein [Paraburkholderia terrae]AUT65793.1 hypothetical protein C2L65_40585 [Paraburkholderia terrae]
MNTLKSFARFFKGFAAVCAVGVAVASTHAEASMGSQPVRVINHTTEPIVAVFVSHDYDPFRGPNLLNMPELRAEWSVLIDPSDREPGCTYDFTVLLKNGTPFTQQVDACPIREAAFWQ